MTVCVAGVAEMVKFGAAVPVPESGRDCGELNALSVMETDALKLPAAAGANLTVMVQVPLTAMGLELTQLSLSVKSPELAPARAVAVMVSGPVPELVRVEVSAALVVPELVLGKASGVGLRVTAGAVACAPVPDSRTVLRWSLLLAPRSV